MPTLTQTPTTTTALSAERPCFWCNGSGHVPNDDEERYDECSACEGSGSRPAPQLTEQIAA